MSVTEKVCLYLDPSKTLYSKWVGYEVNNGILWICSRAIVDFKTVSR